MPTISLCMIVKNEETLLPQCLASVKDFVDEIIVVDTGSTDKTVEIAESFGAKIYHHPWENDFSKHRNQSIFYAAGDWIFWIDADEALKPESAPLIEEVTSREDIDSVLVTLVNFYNNRMSQSYSNQARIFRNNVGIHFRGIVHNMPTGYRSTLPCPIYIYHYGYDLDAEKMKAKFIRTSNLLKQKIKDNLDDFKPRSDLAVSYAMAEMFEEAIEEGIKSIEMSKSTEEKGGVLILWTYFIVASSYLKLGDTKRAEEYALEGLNINPDHLDSNFILAIAYHQLGDWVQFEKAADNYLRILKMLRDNPERFGYMVNNTVNEEWRVHLACGDSYLTKGAKEMAQQAFNLALSLAPNKSQCYQTIAEFYRKQNLWDLAEKNYKHAVEEEPECLSVFLGLALAENHLGKKKEAIRYYERALELKPDSIEALVNLGDLYCEQGAEDLAEKFYEKALGIESRLVNVALRLANFSVKKGEIEACVGHCENILKALGLSYNRTLESMSDLADLFLIIGHELDKAGRDDLFKEAMEVALNLKPELASIIR